MAGQDGATYKLHRQQAHFAATKTHLWQDSTRHEALMLCVIQQACKEIFWPIRLLVCQCLQASVVADVPHLQAITMHCSSLKLDDDSAHLYQC